jgi:hypothetical protein
MIDIFADIKTQPKLYIADVTVTGSYKARANSKKVDKIMILLGKVPIVLADDGLPPTKSMEQKFLSRVYDNHIKKGDFSRMNLRIVAIENITFSSKLAYNFDYNIN